MKLADGRWRCSGPAKYTFTEPDEHLAIAHFREWEAKQQGKTHTIQLPLATATPGHNDEVTRAILATAAPGHVEIKINEDGRYGFHRQPVEDAALWAWLRKMILDEPTYVAERIGIEQIGYLSELPKRVRDTLGGRFGRVSWP